MISCLGPENRRKQIIEVVQYIEERLKELDEEKEELKKYQQLDKQRRSLEYTIFEKELLDARQKLEEVRYSLSQWLLFYVDGAFHVLILALRHFTSATYTSCMHVSVVLFGQLMCFMWIVLVNFRNS